MAQNQTTVGRFQPGHRKIGGRNRGTPNRSTATAREAIARVVEENSGRLQQWLDQIAADEGPRAAWACFLDLIEYHVPKLTRSELIAKAPAFDGTPTRIDDPVSAASAWRAIISGELDPLAIDFAGPSLPAPADLGPGTTPVASAPIGTDPQEPAA